MTRFTADGTTATLRYSVTPSEAIDTTLWYVDRTSCPAAARLDELDTTSEWDGLRSSTGSARQPSQSGSPNRHELTIPTTAPFVFYLVAHGSLAYGCENAGTFRPTPGRHYQLRYVIDPGPFVCVVQIRDLVNGPSGSIRSVPDPTAHFFYPPRRNAGFCQTSTSRTRR